jgi:hypothetical protein
VTPYTPPSSSWDVWSLFSPTWNQYHHDWWRRGWDKYGSRILVADVRAVPWCPAWGGVSMANDTPHGAIANLLRTDYSVASLQNWPSFPTYNCKVHQWDYYFWWIWAEDSLVR